MPKCRLVITIIFMFTGALMFYAVADNTQESFYKEFMAIGGYSDSENFLGKSPGLKNSVGFEYFRKFSNEYGDYATMDIQVRFAYDPSGNSNDAWGVEFHNAFFEYKLGLGEALRIGHFDAAFGLEPVLDTHGTLLQTLAFDNLGFKKDWGLAYKSMLGDFDYEVSATLGSGMSIRQKDDNFLLATRISGGEKAGFEYGLSLLYGQTLMTNESWTIPQGKLTSSDSVKRKRIGFDMRFTLGVYSVLSELIVGDHDGATVTGALLQLDYVLPDAQDITLKLQTKYWQNEINDKDTTDITISPVIQWQIGSKTTIRAGYSQDFYSKDDQDRRIIMQLYHYGL